LASIVDVRGWVLVVGLLVLLVGCSEPQPSVDEAIDSHREEPGMVTFLEVAKDSGVLHGPEDVEAVAGFYTVACQARKGGYRLPALAQAKHLELDPWNLEVTPAQAETLHVAQSALCEAQR
jgi:hypothetical protein